MEPPMASSTMNATGRRPADPRAVSDPGGSSGSPMHAILMRLASLKITATLFVLAIVLIVVGTLAQAEKDVWQVVEGYFRTPIAWIDLRVFFPPSFFPGLVVPYDAHLPGGYVIPLGFYFPGGWLIGGLMMINLIAAHAVRFSVQARGARLKTGWAVLGIGCLLTWLVIAGGPNSEGEPLGAWLPRAAAWLGGSSLRILWQMSKGQVAALVLLLGCVLLFKKRAGIVLLHGGIGLMMLGEVLTGLTAVEGHMQMAEGEATSFVRHTRSVELAVIDHSDPDRDIVVAIPEARLLEGRRIEHDDLPFDVELAHFFTNSTIRPARPDDPNPASAGLGLSWAAEPARPVSGTDGGKVNVPAAYVTLYPKGRPGEIGTYLVGLALSQVGLAEQVQVHGKGYEVSLRHKRTYKPYTMKLIDVRKEDYPGTNIPRHYASRVHLIDDGRHVDRTVTIWMNNPLRYAGETFYQSGYYRDPDTGEEASTLAVVTNTGWMIPYVGCMIVATGMLAHFAITLGRFLRRRPEGRAAAAPSIDDRPATGSSRWARLVPAAAVVLAGVWLVGKAVPPAKTKGTFDLHAFGKLPVLDHGRAKPLATLARDSLQVLSGRQTVADPHGNRQPAIRWLLDLITRPEVAAEYRAFRIENPEVLGTLGLETREGLRYAFHEFADRLGELKKQVELAAATEPSELSTYQKKVLELDRKLALWNTLIQAFIPPEELARSRELAAGLGGMSARQPPPLCIPAATSPEGWLTFAQAQSHRSERGGAEDPVADRATRSLATILGAYAEGDAGTFNREVGVFPAIVGSVARPGLDPARVRYEAYVDHFDPTYHASVLYLGAFVLAALAWLGWSRPLNRASFGLIVVAGCVHTFALASRIYISGRPPVTNLYSSAIFIGWAAMLFGLVLEVVYRVGIGNVIASVIGFATLLVAHFLASSGDTLAVLQAVLDTQFWLATHVVCITLGYSATYVAGLLGIVYILKGVLTRSLSPEAGKELSRMIYGTVAFAMIFSFVGTVLGGLWADDSWGRFWGWDPKENGALIIVLWNAVVLHARWGGLVKQRGLAILAVVGNIAVSWSWFGVNELGIGLHSYGFTEGVLRALMLFVATQAAIIALGLIPESRWRSHPRHGPASAAA
jgi:ABC-type transport system involved in cytochrome c biogenesis permease subunit